MLDKMIKSVLDQDTSPVVLCDLEHSIVYMNKAAVSRYEKRGGASLIGQSLMGCHNSDSNAIIEKVVKWFGESPCNNRIHTFYNEKENKDVYMIALRDENDNLIGYYEKHEYRNIDTTPLYDFK